MAGFVAKLILILLIASCLAELIVAGPAAYAGCMAACMAKMFALEPACAVLCAPALLAPGP